MEKEKFTIEQIVEAIKENRIAYDKEKIIAALILIDKEKGDGVDTFTAFTGEQPNIACAIGMRMYRDPKFKKTVLSACLACQELEKRDRMLAKLDNAFQEAEDTIGKIIGTLEEALGKKPQSRKKKRPSKR